MSPSLPATNSPLAADTQLAAQTTPAICDSCSMELEKDMPSTLSASATKDVRAYEHDRQRSKKTAELGKAQERKEVKGALKSKSGPRAGAVPGKPKCSCRRPERGSRRSPEKKDLRALWDRGEDSREVGEIWIRTPEMSPVRGSFHASRRSLDAEVTLADLVTSKKPRKTKAGDFEVIPHIRSVIVLDDAVREEALDMEEQWEHICGDESDDAKGPSYAQVASIGK